MSSVVFAPSVLAFGWLCHPKRNTSRRTPGTRGPPIDAGALRGPLLRVTLNKKATAFAVAFLFKVVDPIRVGLFQMKRFSCSAFVPLSYGLLLTFHPAESDHWPVPAPTPQPAHLLQCTKRPDACGSLLNRHTQKPRLSDSTHDLGRADCEGGGSTAACPIHAIERFL